MSKIAIIAKLPVQPGKADEFVAAFSTMFPVVADEPGTEVYALHRDAKDDHLFYVYEVYADRAALDAHGGSDGMKSAMAAFGPLLAEGVELIRMEPIQAEGIAL
ncbi:MAG TPA: putative quinol monooxygenase [Acidimicrobiales bacterium]|nr:putative quinol monooxygenase [Acidimicrobiales bacterium]